MNTPVFSVRELTREDFDPLLRYWLEASPEFMRGMGVDVSKIPPREEWVKLLEAQMALPPEEKQMYAVTWLIDGKPSGHSSLSKIVFGEEAYMHLHMWNSAERQKGAGTALVKLTLPHYFEKFRLKRLLCEPYALNPAPNRAMEKLGFTFVKEHVTVPGWLNFEQPVKLWKLTGINS